MKILHTADWHLGRVLHGYSLEEYQATFLDFFVDLVRKEAPEAVLIAGDIFDRSIASIRALELMDRALQKLSALTQVILIPGNHDSASRLGYGTALYHEQIKVFSKYSQVGTPVILDATTPVNIYPIPYLEPDLARFEFSDKDAKVPVARSHQAVNEAAAQRIFADLAKRSGIGIVMAHPFVSGSLTSESERDISVGGVQSIAVDTFKDVGGQIRYVACGHLHRPQSLGAEANYVVRYSGSPLPFSFSEASDVKSITRLDISGTTVKISEIPVPQSYELRSFKGTLAQLEEAELPTENCYYSVEITDPLRPEKLYARVKSKLPLLMNLQYVETGQLHESYQPLSSTATTVDITKQFYEQALGRQLEVAEKTLVQEIWEQIRLEEVENEAN